MSLMAGLEEPPASAAAIYRRFRDAFTDESVKRAGRLWLAGWATDRAFRWAERATALARADATQRDMVAAGEDCPVCLEPFSDTLPSPAVSAPTGADHFTCGRHLLCFECDMRQQASANPRCPLCRGGRTVAVDHHDP